MVRILLTDGPCGRILNSSPTVMPPPQSACEETWVFAVECRELVLRIMDSVMFLTGFCLFESNDRLATIFVLNDPAVDGPSFVTFDPLDGRLID
ncbi:hypothetical protein F2Q68_00034409 [Brassica cretica]|uniref:Uncharacterized protein n=2 Tax=Brassica cretica TaxID=69181 RepID=A0A3N6RCG2_BRACR|nr:hypothetical protein F2Q68_00034409 [Brassica cretica]KAF3486112.1 hypothetical protein F2Q69_00053201 [Brassica cretica]KAF3593288.1 hypothetical protein DY000_02022218 [Brassica cretica]